MLSRIRRDEGRPTSPPITQFLETQSLFGIPAAFRHQSSMDCGICARRSIGYGVAVVVVIPGRAPSSTSSRPDVAQSLRATPHDRSRLVAWKHFYHPTRAAQSTASPTTPDPARAPRYVVSRTDWSSDVDHRICPEHIRCAASCKRRKVRFHCTVKHGNVSV